MPRSRVPLKGEPDFTTISDSKLKDYLDLTQQMIFSYKNVSKEKVDVLKEIWKDISKECTARLSSSAIKELDRQEQEENAPLVTHRIKPVKRIKR